MYHTDVHGNAMQVHLWWVYCSIENLGKIYYEFLLFLENPSNQNEVLIGDLLLFGEPYRVREVQPGVRVHWHPFETIIIKITYELFGWNKCLTNGMLNHLLMHLL